MRKKTISCLLDEIFWGIVYLLPIIFMVLVSFRTGSLVDFETAMCSVGLDILAGNQFLVSLTDLVGAGGLMPIFGDGIIYYMAYFINCWLVHVIVDVFLWLPRFAHKLLQKAGD